MKNTTIGAVIGGLVTYIMVSCTTPPPPTKQEPIKPIENACTTKVWKDRGLMPTGFAKGIAASYKAAIARGEVGRPLGSPETDALAYYGLKPGNELRKTYTFLIGLAMRESSGNYTLGRDYTAKGIQNAMSAETGAWQFSMDAINRDPKLKEIYQYTKAENYNCMNELYGDGIRIRTDGYIDQPAEGLAFQKHFRKCAAAQAEYAAVMIRAVRKHFGPINRKEVEYIPACEEWLRSLE